MDSTISAEMSRRIHERLLDADQTLGAYEVVSDLAFPVSKEMENRIITPLKEGDLCRAHPSTRAVLIFSCYVPNLDLLVLAFQINLCHMQ